MQLAELLEKLKGLDLNDLDYQEINNINYMLENLGIPHNDTEGIERVVKSVIIFQLLQEHAKTITETICLYGVRLGRTPTEYAGCKKISDNTYTTSTGKLVKVATLDDPIPDNIRDGDVTYIEGQIPAYEWQVRASLKMDKMFPNNKYEGYVMSAELGLRNLLNPPKPKKSSNTLTWDSSISNATFTINGGPVGTVGAPGRRNPVAFDAAQYVWVDPPMPQAMPVVEGDVVRVVMNENVVFDDEV